MRVAVPVVRVQDAHHIAGRHADALVHPVVYAPVPLAHQHCDALPVAFQHLQRAIGRACVNDNDFKLVLVLLGKHRIKGPAHANVVEHWNRDGDLHPDVLTACKSVGEVAASLGGPEGRIE